jgi:hypothetical protein
MLLPRGRLVRSMPGETSSRRNFGARSLVSCRPSELNLVARREQSFQSRALSNDAYKAVAIQIVDIDRAAIANSGGVVQAEAMAVNVAEVIVGSFVLNDRNPSIY